MLDIALHESLVLRYYRLDNAFDAHRHRVVPIRNVSKDSVATCLTIKCETVFIGDAISASQVALLQVLMCNMVS